MEFKIVKANIINVSVDAVVLPANSKLHEGSGTSAAIFKAAGRNNLKKACKEIGYCDIGSAVATLAYDMRYPDYIIHAVVPRWKDGNHDEYGLLSSAYLTSLKIADVMKCESIAFPLLSSGNNGFDRKLAFQIAKESIESFKGENLKKVMLVVFDDTTECFVRTLGYPINIIYEATPVNEDSSFVDKTKEAALQGLKIAEEWLKKPENIKKLLKTGLSIASVVLASNKTAKTVLDKINQTIHSSFDDIN